MGWEVQKRNGIYLPQIDWHLDARKPVSKAFISHAHFDHCGKHATIVCSEGTARLLQARLGGEREYRTYEFGESFEIADGTTARMYPAGHIPGSAMLLLEREGESLLYTGDFKLSPSLIAEPCSVQSADVLIVETTYGLPKYAFPPSTEVAQDILSFCKGAIDDGNTPVLFGYSLGKAQEIIKALTDSPFEIMVHPEVFRMTRICEELGFEFPPYTPLQASSHAGKVIVGPPPSRNSSWLETIDRPATAMISGWALDESFRYRSQADRAFPLSDHSDFLDLQEFVRAVSPKIVYTTHGFAKEFAETLTEQGYKAWALGSENQMGLGLPTASANAEQRRTPSNRVSETPVSSPNPNSVLEFALMIESVAKTEGQTEKAKIMAEYLGKLDARLLCKAALFASGRVFPKSSKRTLPVDRKLDTQALLFATETSESEYRSRYRELRDRDQALVGALSADARGSRTLEDIRSLFRHLEKAPNPVFQHSILATEYRKLAPLEALCLTRLIQGDLKAGIDESTVEIALAHRFGAPLDAIRRAHQRCSDLEEVANAAVDGLLEYVPIKVFHPLPLVHPAMGQIDLESLSKLDSPIWIEDLYDGLRCQIHKVDERVEIFDRSGNDLTHKFPEIIESAALIPQNFIADGTLLAWEKETPLPFTALEERLSLPASDLLLGEEVDTTVWLHDLLWDGEQSMLEKPLSLRKRELNTFSVNPKLRISPVTKLDSPHQIQQAAQEARGRGHLGVIAKNASAPYDTLGDPGWIRFKQ
jgi:DNA ligase-1